MILFSFTSLVSLLLLIPVASATTAVSAPYYNGSLSKTVGPSSSQETSIQRSFQLSLYAQRSTHLSVSAIASTFSTSGHPTSLRSASVPTPTTLSLDSSASTPGSAFSLSSSRSPGSAVSSLYSVSLAVEGTNQYHSGAFSTRVPSTSPLFTRTAAAPSSPSSISSYGRSSSQGSSGAHSISKLPDSEPRISSALSPSVSGPVVVLSASLSSVSPAHITSLSSRQISRPTHQRTLDSFSSTVSASFQTQRSHIGTMGQSMLSQSFKNAFKRTSSFSAHRAALSQSTTGVSVSGVSIKRSSDTGSSSSLKEEFSSSTTPTTRSNITFLSILTSSSASSQVRSPPTSRSHNLKELPSFSISGPSSGSAVASLALFTGTLAQSSFRRQSSPTSLKGRSLLALQPSARSYVHSSSTEIRPASQTNRGIGSVVRGSDTPSGGGAVTTGRSHKTTLPYPEYSASPSSLLIRSSPASWNTVESGSALDYTIVTAYTTYCATPTTFTYNSQTVNVSTPTTVVVTDCPCTLTRGSTTASWTLASPTAATKGSISLRTKPVGRPSSTISVSDTSTTTISVTQAVVVTKKAYLSSETSRNVIASNLPSSVRYNPVLTTTVSALTTVCSTPTTFAVNSRTYALTSLSTLTIYNCVLTKDTSSSASWHLVVDSTSMPGPQSSATIEATSTTSAYPVTSFIASSFTTEYSSATTVAWNSKTYTVTGPTTLTVTDCPCTLTRPLSQSASSPTSLDHPSSTGTPRLITEATQISIYASASSALRTIEGSLTPSAVAPSVSNFMTESQDYSTTVVSSFTTFCPTATTFTFNAKTYSASLPTTFTITDCPCTLVHSGPGASKAPATSTNSVEIVTETSATRSVKTLPSIRASDTNYFSQNLIPSTMGSSVFTTYCSTPTTFAVGSVTYTATGPESFTITIGQPVQSLTATLHESSSGNSVAAYSSRGEVLTETTVLTTFCPSPTTFTLDSKTYTATGPTSFTITKSSVVTESSPSSAYTNTVTPTSGDITIVPGRWTVSTSVASSDFPGAPPSVASLGTTTLSSPATHTLGETIFTVRSSSALPVTHSLSTSSRTDVEVSTTSPLLSQSLDSLSLEMTHVPTTFSQASVASATDSVSQVYVSGPTTTLSVNGRTYAVSSATTMAVPIAPVPSPYSAVPSPAPTSDTNAAYNLHPDSTTTIARVTRVTTLTRHNTKSAVSSNSVGSGTSASIVPNTARRLAASCFMLTLPVIVAFLA